MRRLAAVLVAASALVAAPAAAEECTYTDLHGSFTLRADCAGLGDYSGIGNEQKRLWLAGAWGELNVLEVPPPHKQDATQLAFIMGNLGRVHTERRSPGGVTSATIGGQEALTVVEHKMRASSRSWVVHWQGRNLIVRAVAYGTRAERLANIDRMAAVVGTWAAAAAPPAEERPRVRDRKDDAPAATAESAPSAPAPAEPAPAEPAPAE